MPDHAFTFEASGIETNPILINSPAANSSCSPVDRRT
jgi:hypothetical protein